VRGEGGGEEEEGCKGGGGDGEERWRGLGENRGWRFWGRGGGEKGVYLFISSFETN